MTFPVTSTEPTTGHCARAAGCVDGPTGMIMITTRTGRRRTS